MKLLIPFFLLITSYTSGQSASTHCKQAEQFFNQNKPALALQSINKALKLDSVKLYYWNVKIECLQSLQKWEEVLKAYDKAISLHPDTAYLYCNRGSLLTNLGYFDEAIQDFNKGIVMEQSDEDKLSFLISRSAAEISKRDFTSAYNDLLNAFRIDSTNIGVLVNLGSVCDEVGKGEETLYYLLKAQALAPRDVAVTGNIGFKYQQLGDYPTSIDYFNKILAIEPKNGQGYSNRSYSYFKMGNITAAKSDIEKAISYYPDNSYAYWVRAQIYISDKQFTAACADLQTALDKGYTITYGNAVQELKDKYCQPPAR